MIHGFDVSAYQGASIPTCDFAFVKATEGASYSSSKFAAQWASARSKAAVRGAYHFARPEQSSAASQADRLIASARAVPGELLCLDLEASGLSQAYTNAWARAFGDRLRERAPGVRTVLYLGSGYAANNTGRDLNQHFDLWWYPQYPSAYQLALEDVETLRIANRTAVTSTRSPIAARASLWPPTFSPWLPPGLTTGWKAPHLWQFTDNLNGLDASVSPLTLDQLAAGGHQEDTMPYGGQLQPGAGTRANISFPRGSMSAIGLVYDSTEVAEVRVAVHHQSKGGGEVYTLNVGGPASDKDSWPSKTVQKFKTPTDADWVSLTRVDGGDQPVGWDMS